MTHSYFNKDKIEKEGSGQGKIPLEPN
jgi:hypothetical protein